MSIAHFDIGSYPKTDDITYLKHLNFNQNKLETPQSIVIHGKLGQKEAFLAEKTNNLAPVTITVLGGILLAGLLISFEAAVLSALIVSPIFIIPWLLDVPISSFLPERSYIPSFIPIATPRSGTYIPGGIRSMGGSLPSGTTPSLDGPYATVGSRRTGGSLPSGTIPSSGGSYSTVGGRATGGSTTSGGSYATVGSRRT